MFFFVILNSRIILVTLDFLFILSQIWQNRKGDLRKCNIFFDKYLRS